MSRSKNNLVSRQEEIIGILLITFGLLVLLSLLTYNPNEQPGNIEIGQIDNQLGIAGVYIAYFLNHYLIGRPSFVLPLIIMFIGWSMFRGHSLANSLRWSAYLLIFAVYTSIILALPEVISPAATDLGYSLSGRVGGLVAQFMHHSLGVVGTILVLLAMIMITFIGATRISFSEFITEFMHRMTSIVSAVRSSLKRMRKRPKLKKESSPSVSKGFDSADKEVIEDVESGRGKNNKSAKKPQMEMELEAQEPGDAAGAALRREFLDPGNYKFPSLELLSMPQARDDEITKEELYANAQILEDRLLEFGVQGKVTDINPGPVITRYEVEPAPGVKISRIVSLADDLALAMRAKSVRIVAPIPGKGAVGIELPNRNREMVYLKEVIRSKQFEDSESPLTLAVGKTISGKPYVAKLDEMPHLLIAGATGSGKSVCLSSIIASILYKAHPTQVQMIMIDPKRLELSIFSNLRHHHLNYREDLNEEVVTSPANAISLLKSLERVMEDRYEILARAGVRNIGDYNRKLRSGQLTNQEGEDPYEPLEYLVLIVDELADLMVTAAREVEEPIARLTQMSRAVGIHLIVATQRPSVDVITGVIKANFPARIAFQVASKTDSRTILDANGAEKLLGMGDMLFIPPGSPEPIRLHGTFISTDEVERIIGHIRKQPKYPKHKLPIEKETGAGMPGEEGFGFSGDELFLEAAKLVVRHQQGSISLLQRRLKVGYARAARLIDELEAAGVVGPFDGSKAREVLVGDEEELEELGLV